MQVQQNCTFYASTAKIVLFMRVQQNCTFYEKYKCKCILKGHQPFTGGF